MILQTATDLNVASIFYYNLKNTLPLDMTLIGLCVLLGFAFLAWKTEHSATAIFPLVLVMLYAIWLGTGRIFPFNALLVLSFGLIATFLLLGLLKFADKQHLQ